MGYLIFRNVSTESLQNVYVSEMPSHRKASSRMTEYYVKGRDGALHVFEGYANFDIKVVLVLINAGVTSRQQVNAWADGTGKLVTSDDLTRAYKATVIDEVRWKRVKAATFIPTFSPDVSYSAGDYVRYSGTVYQFVNNHTGAWDANDVSVRNYLVNGLFDTATITFNCQPYMYEAADSSITLTGTTTIFNPGSATALPLIKVYGTGTAQFTFAGYPIRIDDMQPGEAIYIDCENGYVYSEEGGATMVGEIPELQMGTNTITFESNVSSIVVTPRWRWI